MLAAEYFQIVLNAESQAAFYSDDLNKSVLQAVMYTLSQYPKLNESVPQWHAPNMKGTTCIYAQCLHGEAEIYAIMQSVVGVLNAKNYKSQIKFVVIPIDEMSYKESASKSADKSDSSSNSSDEEEVVSPSNSISNSTRPMFAAVQHIHHENHHHHHHHDSHVHLLHPSHNGNSNHHLESIKIPHHHHVYHHVNHHRLNSPNNNHNNSSPTSNTSKNNSHVVTHLPSIGANATNSKKSILAQRRSSLPVPPPSLPNDYGPKSPKTPHTTIPISSNFYNNIFGPATSSEATSSVNPSYKFGTSSNTTSTNNTSPTSSDSNKISIGRIAEIKSSAKHFLAMTRRGSL